jgi:hypothetical protein
MLSSDKRAMKGANDAGKTYTPQIALSSEIRTYATPSGGSIRIQYKMSWIRKTWTFTVSTLDVDSGAPLGQDQGAVYEDIRDRFEAQFRKDRRIV